MNMNSKDRGYELAETGHPELGLSSLPLSGLTVGKTRFGRVLVSGVDVINSGIKSRSDQRKVNGLSEIHDRRIKRSHDLRFEFAKSADSWRRSNCSLEGFVREPPQLRATLLCISLGDITSKSLHWAHLNLRFSTSIAEPTFESIDLKIDRLDKFPKAPE
ncbi:hypothetical protein ACFE04_019608 [Oxalis oulophora]